ncbi:LysR substrate-binding domain-containing protein, partial [Rhizobiaceae sp. 2RAB30]
VNDTAVSIAATLDGIGLSYVAEPLVEKLVEDGKLELVLQDYVPETPGMFLYFPSRLQALPKLKAFVTHMRRALADYMRARDGRPGS